MVHDRDGSARRERIEKPVRQKRVEPDYEPDYEAIMEARAEARKPAGADSLYWEGER